MKYDVPVLTAFAVSIVSVRASPVQMIARSAGAPTDPFVTCMQKLYPHFPKEGNPAPAEIQTCVNDTRPQATHPNVSAGTGVIAQPYENNATTQVSPRGLIDIVDGILGEKLGLGPKPLCQDEGGQASKLHDEFVWAREVIPLADAICDDANTYLRKKGFNQRGAAGYAQHEFRNAYDEKANTLYKGRKLLLTLATTVLPPVGVALQTVEAAKANVGVIAEGIHKVCSAGIQKILNPQDGCSQSVKWYVSQKAKYENELAAMGGTIDVFLGNPTDRAGSILIGFSQDSN